MQTRLTLILLALLLAACAPVVKLAETPVVTSTPTQTPASPTLTPTPEFTPITPTLLPTQPPIPILTPDAIQVERWREYQAELAKGILPMEPIESILCEWDILARAGQEVYVWAICASPRGDDMRPAVIHVGTDGSIQSVEIPERGSGNSNKWFPEAARVKFGLYAGDSIFSGRVRELYSHIEYRKTHPEEPPLIVLSAAPVSTPTLLPTQPPISILTPDAIQVEHWREYQAELAKVVLAGYSPDLGYDPDLYKYALCEWDILGRSGQEVYVWVLCAIQGGGNGRGPAVIHLDPNGTIQSVKVAGYDGPFYDLGLFPEDVQEKLDIYISPPFSGGRLLEMGSRLDYRLIHPEEPPLIVLSDALVITPTP
jgi:hypothetical protein